MLTAGANKRLTNIFKKEKLGNEVSIGFFEKLQHIPGTLEAHVHFQDCAYAQETPEKVLLSYLWLP